MMQGKLFTSIEAAADFNGLCLVPNTGMIFAANEDTKIQTYYIPVSTSCIWIWIVMLVYFFGENGVVAVVTGSKPE